MLRAIVLSLVLLIGVGVVIVLPGDRAEAGQQKKAKKKSRKRKYSRRYRAAGNRRESAAAKRARALRIAQIRLARQQEIARNGGKWVVITTWNGSQWISRDKWIAITSDTPTVPVPDALAVAGNPEKPEPKVIPTQKNWQSEGVKNGALQFNVDAGQSSAQVSVVGPATGEDGSKSVGGVPVDSLRRTVIDLMIRENGWVVNDYRKEIGGRQVYVVVAQSNGAGGQLQSRLFYFTAADGRIYSVATSSPGDALEKLAAESERVITSLQRGGRTTQADLR